MDGDSAHTVQASPACFICAPLPRCKVRLIELCHNVSLSEKLFMYWQCDQVKELFLIQFDLGSAVFTTAGYTTQVRGITIMFYQM